MTRQHAREYQDILDTLKRGLLKNTNIRGLYWKLLIIANVIRHIGRVVEQIGRPYPQIPQPLKVSRDFRVPKRGRHGNISHALKGSRGSRIVYCQICQT